MDLSRAGKELADECEVNRHDEIDTVASKNCDKLIAYTSVVSICAYFKTVQMQRICQDK
jgi:hypothetical protein